MIFKDWHYTRIYSYKSIVFRLQLSKLWSPQISCGYTQPQETEQEKGDWELLWKRNTRQGFRFQAINNTITSKFQTQILHIQHLWKVDFTEKRKGDHWMTRALTNPIALATAHGNGKRPTYKSLIHLIKENQAKYILCYLIFVHFDWRKCCKNAPFASEIRGKKP